MAPERRQPLTAREAECLRLAALGMTTLESARELGVAQRTVEFHLTNAMRKLGAQNKIRAVVLAVQQNLIQEPQPSAQTLDARAQNETA